MLSNSTVTAIHAAEFDETYQVWNKTTLNFGPRRFDPELYPSLARYMDYIAPVQVQYHDDVRLPRIGLGVETLDDVPAAICNRLFGAVALFGTVETS